MSILSCKHDHGTKWTRKSRHSWSKWTTSITQMICITPIIFLLTPKHGTRSCHPHTMSLFNDNNMSSRICASRTCVMSHDEYLLMTLLTQCSSEWVSQPFKSCWLASKREAAATATTLWCNCRLYEKLKFSVMDGARCHHGPWTGWEERGAGKRWTTIFGHCGGGRMGNGIYGNLLKMPNLSHWNDSDAVPAQMTSSKDEKQGNVILHHLASHPFLSEMCTVFPTGSVNIKWGGEKWIPVGDEILNISNEFLRST